ncbi:MAG TPA: hypothetical protein VGV12_06690 [Gemmatimonadales bacterium]|nr:hypothetical protein [Gemmatimonadales bacterium]
MRQPRSYRGLTFRACIALAGCAATAVIPLHAQGPPARLTTFLQQSIGLDQDQLAAIERGDVVVKVLETQNKRDVAVFGIITVDVPRVFYVTRLQDFPNALRAPTRPHFGIFSTPASPADVADATVPAQDFDDIKKCKPGDCKFKMPAADMQRLHSEIDWSAADVGTQLDAYLRRRLVEYVTDYRTRGDSAMVVYDDVGGVHSSDAFAALLAQSPYVYQDFPSLQQYLTTYPRAELEGAREVLFWADDAPSGLQTILSVTHEVVFAPSELSDMTVVASKQIYADHYFEGVFDLTGIVDRAREGGKPGIYLVLLRRFRFDDLPSGILNIRGKVVGKLRDQLRADLKLQKTTSEKALGS